MQMFKKYRVVCSCFTELYIKRIIGTEKDSNLAYLNTIWPVLRSTTTTHLTYHPEKAYSFPGQSRASKRWSQGSPEVSLQQHPEHERSIKSPWKPSQLDQTHGPVNKTSASWGSNTGNRTNGETPPARQCLPCYWRNMLDSFKPSWAVSSPCRPGVTWACQPCTLVGMHAQKYVFVRPSTYSNAHTYTLESEWAAHMSAP